MSNLVHVDVVYQAGGEHFRHFLMLSISHQQASPFPAAVPIDIGVDGKAQAKPAKLFVGTTTTPAEPVISYTATLEDKAYASADDAVKAIVVTKTTDGKGETITEGFTVAPAVKDTEKSTATEEVYTVVITFADKTTKTLTFKVTVSAGKTEIKDEVKTAETVDEVAKVDDADL